MVEARARRSGAGDQPLAVPVSALTGEGVDTLVRRLAERVDDYPLIEAVLPAGEGRALAWLYAHGRVVAREEAESGGARLEVRLEPQALGRFERLFPGAVVRQAAS